MTVDRDQEIRNLYSNPPESGPRPVGIPTYTTLTSLEKYEAEFGRCKEIFINRNAIYKDTFVHLGLLGTVTTLMGDVFRLRNMVYQDRDHGRGYVEEIDDKLMDVVNQALISLMMLHERNFEGR